MSSQRRDRIAGSVVILLGVLVAVFAIIAVRGSDSGHSSSGDSTKTTSSSSRPSTNSSDPASSSPRSSSSRAGSSTSAQPGRSSVHPPSGSSSRSSGSTVALKSIPLLVENNTLTNGLAAGAKARFEAAGWTVSGVGTMSNDIISTCAYYDPSVDGAKEAAEELRREFPAIKRVVPRFAELAPGPVVVVLTSDYSPN